MTQAETERDPLDQIAGEMLQRFQEELAKRGYAIVRVGPALTEADSLADLEGRARPDWRG